MLDLHLGDNHVKSCGYLTCRFKMWCFGVIAISHCSNVLMHSNIIILLLLLLWHKPHRAAFVVEPDFVIPRANLTKLYATTTACIGLWKYLSYLRSVFTKEETCTDGLFFYTTTFKQKGKVLSNNGKGMTWNLLFLLPAFTLILITGAYWCCQTLLFCAKV